MTKFLHLISLMFIGLLFGCKKPPNISIENNFDPLSEGYILPTLTQFRYQISNPLINQVKLSWQILQDNPAEGFELFRSIGDSTNYELVKIFNSNERSFSDLIPRNSTNIYYKINAFLEVNEKKVFSKFELIEIEQTIDTFDIYYEFPNKFKLIWNHSFEIDSELLIYRKIDSENFTLLSSTSISEGEYIDIIEVPENSISYKILIQNEVDTLSLESSNILGKNLPEPQDYYLENISPNTIKLGWNFIENDIDGLVLDLYKTNGSLETLVNSFRTTMDDQFIIISELDHNSSYQIRGQSVKGFIYSEVINYIDLFAKETLIKSDSLVLPNLQNILRSSISISSDNSMIAIGGLRTTGDSGIILNLDDLTTRLITEPGAREKFKMSFFERNDTTFLIQHYINQEVTIWNATNLELHQAIPSFYEYHGLENDNSLIYDYAIIEEEQKLLLSSSDTFRGELGQINVWDLEENEYIPFNNGNFDVYKSNEILRVKLSSTFENFLISSRDTLFSFSAKPSTFGDFLGSNLESSISNNTILEIFSNEKNYILRGVKDLFVYNMFENSYTLHSLLGTNNFILDATISNDNSNFCIAESDNNSFVTFSCYDSSNKKFFESISNTGQSIKLQLSPDASILSVLMDTKLIIFKKNKIWTISR